MDTLLQRQRQKVEKDENTIRLMIAICIHKNKPLILSNNIVYIYLINNSIISFTCKYFISNLMCAFFPNYPFTKPETGSPEVETSGWQ